MMAHRSPSRLRKVPLQFLALARLFPLVPGSLVGQYVRCGKPHCRCNRGRKHGPLYYLYWKEQGRSRSLYVPREKVSELRRQTKNYRRFQAQLTRLLRLQLREWRRRMHKERRP
jgi:hypothetical protein